MAVTNADIDADDCWEIRLATEEDVPAIHTFVRAAVAVMNASGNFQWDGTYPMPEHFIADIKNSELYVYCDANKRVLGVVALTKEPVIEYEQVNLDLKIPAITPHRLGVSLDAQGQGVAKRMLAYADVIAKMHGMSCVRVDTNMLNAKMQRVILSNGFEFKGEIELMAKKGLRFYCYEKFI